MLLQFHRDGSLHPLTHCISRDSKPTMSISCNNSNPQVLRVPGKETKLLRREKSNLKLQLRMKVSATCNNSHLIHTDKAPKIGVYLLGEK